MSPDILLSEAEAAKFHLRRAADGGHVIDRNPIHAFTSVEQRSLIKQPGRLRAPTQTWTPVFLLGFVSEILIQTQLSVNEDSGHHSAQCCAVLMSK